MQRRIGGQSQLPVVLRQNWQRQKSQRENCGVNLALPLRIEITCQQMRVEISEKQHELEKKQANGPDGSHPAKPRQNDLCDEGFCLKQKKGAEENRQTIDQL